MIDKIKQNKRTTLIVLGMALLVIAFFMMLLPGSTMKMRYDKEDPFFFYSISIFALAFGGNIKYTLPKGEEMEGVLKSAINGYALVSVILLLLAIIICGVLIYAAITNKINKNIILGLLITVIVFCVVSAILILIMKNSTIDSAIKGAWNNNPSMHEEYESFSEFYNEMKEHYNEIISEGLGVHSIGIGAILTSVFGVIGGGLIGASQFLKANK